MNQKDFSLVFVSPKLPLTLMPRTFNPTRGQRPLTEEASHQQAILYRTRSMLPFNNIQRFRRFIDSRNNAYVQDLDFEFL